MKLLFNILIFLLSAVNAQATYNPVKCPSGMSFIPDGGGVGFDFCVDTSQRASTGSYALDAGTCANSGYFLCTSGQWTRACSYQGGTGAWMDDIERTSTRYNDTDSYTKPCCGGAPTCSGSATSALESTPPQSFRCCFRPAPKHDVDIKYGFGSDGAGSIAASGTKNCSTESISGRATADCMATNISTTSSSGQPTLTVASSTGFATGDEVLVIQMLGTGVGNYEFKTVSSVAAGSITLTSSLTNTYTNDGTPSRAQVVRVPNTQL